MARDVSPSTVTNRLPCPHRVRLDASPSMEVMLETFLNDESVKGEYQVFSRFTNEGHSNDITHMFWFSEEETAVMFKLRFG